MPTEPTPRRSEDELIALVRRKAAGMRQRRRMAALGAATLALVLIATGVAIAGNGTAGSKRTVRVAGGGATTTVEETTTTSESTTSTTSAPPPPPVISTTSTTAPPRHWTATSGPMSIDVTATPGAPAAGQAVKYVVHAHADHGDVLFLSYDFGDTSGDDIGSLACDVIVNGQAQGASPDSPPTDKTMTYRHAYRTPGTYKVMFLVGGTVCTGGYGVSVTGALTVGPGPKLTNGPVPADVQAMKCDPTYTCPPDTPQGSPGAVYVQANGTIYDGYVRRLTFDWGDGTAPTVVDFPFSDCVDDGQHWPHATGAGGVAARSHAYAVPGHHVVTVKAVSSGCRGEQPQTGAASLDVN